MNRIDNLIEHLKGSDPYGKTETFKLWEALKTLNDNIISLDNLFRNNIENFILETPAGLINGVNTKFFLNFKPVNNFVLGFKNGLLLINITDFIVVDNRIIMTIAPAALSILKFVYCIRRQL